MFFLLACSAPQLTGEFVSSPIGGSGQVQFQADPDAVVHVEYGLDGLDQVSEAVPGALGFVSLVGLKNGATYTLQIVAETEEGTLRSEVFEAAIPEPPSGAPLLQVSRWEPELACDPGGHVLLTYASEATSGVAVIDRDGDYVWAVGHEDPASVVTRARPGRDGQSILWSTAERVPHKGALGKLIRRSLDGRTQTETALVEPHDDFVELSDGRIAWLAYEFSQPMKGVIFESLATDRILVTREGDRSVIDPEELFSTLKDYTHGVYELPPEGKDGASVPAADEFGHGASLAYRESDGALFLMWRWLDTLLKIEPSAGVSWEWGGRFGDLVGEDSFVHGHFSDLWDDGVLVFDNRLPEEGRSRLVAYRFDDATFERTWELQTAYESGAGDVRRIPGCDNLLVSSPELGRVTEITRDGQVAWELTSESPLGRAHFLHDLHDLAAE